MEGNPNEVASTRYVTQAELSALVQEAAADPSVKLTPWFRLMTTGDINAKNSSQGLHFLCLIYTS